MCDIKKLLLIDALTFIPGETQDDLLRIAIDLPEFRRIPKEGHITDYSKQKVQYDLQRCVTPQLSLLFISLCCVSLRHVKLSYCGFFFLRMGLVQSSKKNHYSGIEH